MTQYCRYCQHMICGDDNYCEALDECYSDKRIKRSNHCHEFELNPIDALQENLSGYKPRERRTENPVVQMTFEDVSEEEGV